MVQKDRNNKPFYNDHSELTAIWNRLRRGRYGQNSGGGSIGGIKIIGQDGYFDDAWIDPEDESIIVFQKSPITIPSITLDSINQNIPSDRFIYNIEVDPENDHKLLLYTKPIPAGFELQPATAETLGGIKIGTGLEMDGNNKLNVVFPEPISLAGYVNSISGTPQNGYYISNVTKTDSASGSNLQFTYEKLPETDLSNYYTKTESNSKFMIAANFPELRKIETISTGTASGRLTRNSDGTWRFDNNVYLVQNDLKNLIFQKNGTDSITYIPTTGISVNIKDLILNIKDKHTGSLIGTAFHYNPLDGGSLDISIPTHTGDLTDDGLWVLKAGDTMTGPLVIGSASNRKNLTVYGTSTFYNSVTTNGLYVPTSSPSPVLSPIPSGTIPFWIGDGDWASEPGGGGSGGYGEYLTVTKNGQNWISYNGEIPVTVDLTLSLNDILGTTELRKIESLAVGSSNGVLYRNNTGVWSFKGINTQNEDVATVGYVDNAVAGATKYKGTYNAQTGTVNGTSSTFTSIAESQGDMYKVSVAGTYLGAKLDVGDSIIFISDVPAGTAPTSSQVSFIEADVPITPGTQTLAWSTAVTLATVDGVDIVAELPANPNTDTLNTAGSTQDTGKLYLIGAKTQAAYAQTYSNSNIYIQSGKLYVDDSEVITGHGPSYGKITPGATSSSTSVPTSPSKSQISAPGANSNVNITPVNKWVDVSSGSGTINIWHALSSQGGHNTGSGESTSGLSFAIPYLGWDEAGHITSYGNRTHSITGAQIATALNNQTITNLTITNLTVPGTMSVPAHAPSVTSTSTVDFWIGDGDWASEPGGGGAGGGEFLTITKSGRSWISYNGETPVTVDLTLSLTDITGTTELRKIESVSATGLGVPVRDSQGQWSFNNGFVSTISPTSNSGVARPYVSNVTKTGNTITFTYSTLPIATTAALGMIKVGSRLSIAADGTLSADDQSYTLPSELSAINAAATATSGVTTGFLKRTGSNTWTFDNNSYSLSTHTHTVTVISGKKADGTTNISGVSAASQNPSVTLGDSGAAAGAYGDSSAQTPTYGGTFKVPYVRVNAKGIVTEISEHTVKIPSSDDTNTASLQVSDTTNKRINTSETTAKYIQFTGGTNKFNVKDAAGNNFDVAVTPSITNNVVYTGTLVADEIAVWNNTTGTLKSSGWKVSGLNQSVTGGELSNDATDLNKINLSALTTKVGNVEKSNTGSSVNIIRSLSVSALTSASELVSGGKNLTVRISINGQASTDATITNLYATYSSHVNTISRSTNADHYLTFVDSNNNTATSESVYTDADLKYNPSTNVFTHINSVLTGYADVRGALYVPTSAPSSPLSGKTAFWVGDGDWASEPGGGSGTFGELLTITKGGQSWISYNGETPVTADLTLSLNDIIGTVELRKIESASANGLGVPVRDNQGQWTFNNGFVNTISPTNNSGVTRPYISNITKSGNTINITYGSLPADYQLPSELAAINTAATSSSGTTTGYLKRTGTNTWVFANETYALSTHNHDSVYVKKSDVSIPATVPTAAYGSTTTVGTVDGKDFKFTMPAQYTLPAATTAALGGVKVYNSVSSAITAAAGDTANRYYGLQIGSDGKAFVNVPWENTHNSHKVDFTASSEGGQSLAPGDSFTVIETIDDSNTSTGTLSSTYHTVEYTLPVFPEDTEPITYTDLKTKRNGGGLTPGQWYRITDYVTTTTKAFSRAMGHQFDILVLATDASHLSEAAGACLHSGDTYFANTNFSKWRIWYCLDNDTNRCDWVDTTNGKGVIYRMIDEWDNDIPYDFKNIQFKRYKVTAKSTNPELAVLNNLYLGNETDTTGLDKTTSDYKWFYTFSQLGSAWTTDATDASLSIVSNEVATRNIWGPKPTGNEVTQQLNNIVCMNGPLVETFLKAHGEASDYDGSVSIDFVSGVKTNDLTFFGPNGNVKANSCFRHNIIVGVHRHMDYKTDCQNNTVVCFDDFCFNTLDDGFNNNVIVTTEAITQNRFDEYFQNNVINIIGYIKQNEFGPTFYNNKIYCSIINNTFGPSVHDNTFGTLGEARSNYIQRNVFGPTVYHCSFKSFFMLNRIYGQITYCNFGSYVVTNTIDPILQYVDIPDGTSSTMFRGVHIRGNLRGTSTAHITLDSSEFRGGVSGINRAITIEGDTDGKIIATWFDGQYETGIYKTTTETTWHALPRFVRVAGDTMTGSLTIGSSSSPANLIVYGVGTFSGTLNVPAHAPSTASTDTTSFWIGDGDWASEPGGGGGSGTGELLTVTKNGQSWISYNGSVAVTTDLTLGLTDITGTTELRKIETLATSGGGFLKRNSSTGVWSWDTNTYLTNSSLNGYFNTINQNTPSGTGIIYVSSISKNASNTKQIDVTRTLLDLSSFATKEYVDNAVAGATIYRGTYNANTNKISSGTNNGKTFTEIANRQGDMYKVNVAGTYLSTTLQVGDFIIFISDVAAGTAPTANDVSFVEADVSVSDGNPTLAWGTQSVVGTVEGVNLHVTLPANPNTDSKVTQAVTASTNTSWRPLILGYSYSDATTFAPSTVTNTTYATHLAKFKPDTGVLAVVGFNKLTTSGTISTGSNTDVWNTNGGITSLSGYSTTSHGHKITVISGKKSDGTTDITATSSTAAATPSVTLGASGVTAGAYGDSSNQTPVFGGSFKVPYIRVNAQGIVNEISAHTVTIPSETTLSKGTTTGTGNAVTDISVSGHTITLTKGTTFLTAHQTLTNHAKLADTTTASQLMVSSGSSAYSWKSYRTLALQVGGAAIGSGYDPFGSANITLNITKSNLTTALESDGGYYVKKSGDTMTGSLVMEGSAVNIRIKGGNQYFGEASGSQCHIQYDNTNKCLNFIFD